MEEKILIETLGAIAKGEDVTSLDHNIMQNTLVLENKEPFPGYHGQNLPSESVPMYLYFVTNKKYSVERVMRMTQNIKAYFPHNFDGSAGKICIYNDTYYCIRIRELQSFEQIAELQSCYVDEGVRFMKRKNLNAPAVIQVRKHFYLEKLDNGIYHDLEEPMMYYIQIPFQVRWKMFTSITAHIKNNVDNNNFDAALGAVYMRDIMDVVRIYANDLTLDKLNFLKDKYEQEILKQQPALAI